MLKINAEDECNDTYGRIRMYQTLSIRTADGVDIPSERPVYRAMEAVGLSHRPKRKSHGITEADRAAAQWDNLLKRDVSSNESLKTCITDITEIKARKKTLYVSAIFVCFDSGVLGLAMETNMKAPLCCHTIEHACLAYLSLGGATLHSDRGSQYTSERYRLCTWHPPKHEQRRWPMP